MSSVIFKFAVIHLPVAMLFANCASVRDNPKYTFSDGTYKVRTTAFSGKGYVKADGERIRIYPADEQGNYDSLRSKLVSPAALETYGRNNRFVKYSVDFDLVSLPLKFRPSQPRFPHQLNSAINGGLYFGRRADIYRIHNKRTEIGTTETTIKHFGLSAGLFAGLGSTPMNPSVTDNRISIEYDGVVIPIGITGLAAHKEFTFGLSLGVDYMPDSHRKFWIYRNKPWIGLAVGLNLN